MRWNCHQILTTIRPTRPVAPATTTRGASVWTVIRTLRSLHVRARTYNGGDPDGTKAEAPEIMAEAKNVQVRAAVIVIGSLLPLVFLFSAALCNPSLISWTGSQHMGL